MSEKKLFSYDPNTPLPVSDIRVSPGVEVEIKAELSVRPLPNLIEEFLSAETVEQRAQLQEEITRRAKMVHEILGSNEP